jgi:DNA-binding CsgD family transcriptional regulator
MQNSDPVDLPMRLGQVAELIALGYSDKQIAQELKLSPRTIHRHVVRLLARLGVENRAAAAAVWARSTVERGAAAEAAIPGSRLTSSSPPPRGGGKTGAVPDE